MSRQIYVRYSLRHVGGIALWPSFLRARRACDRLVQGEIERRRRRGEDHDDLLGLLLRARNERGARLADGAVGDMLRSVIAATQDTTSVGTAWAVERLVRHPEAWNRLAADGDGGLYTDAVIRETLRLRPPIAFIARRCLRPYALGDYELRPGTTLVVHLRALHHDPALYPDPLAFQPDRWLAGRSTPPLWIPFGGGAHRCIGEHLAMMQMRTILHTLAGSVRLRPAEPVDEPIRWKAVFNLPGRDCRVVLHRDRAR